jgi:CHAD domain-containing protein
MNREEIGEFLYRFYRKRATSFLANIYKVSITGDAKDIHRARLDVKKIFALYGLFEMLDPTAFKHKGGYKLFRPLYRQAGKIREIQVNYMLLADPKNSEEACPSFILWLREEERQATKRYLQLVKKFKDPELDSTDKIIQKICKSSSIFKLKSKTEHFIYGKALQIKELKSEELNDKEIHKIRRNLKVMSTVVTLVYTVKPTNKLDGVISALNKTEMMIGDWHDKVVLKETINRFLEGNTPIPREESDALNTLKQELTDYTLNLVQHFMPEVNVIVDSLLVEKADHSSR